MFMLNHALAVSASQSDGLLAKALAREAGAMLLKLQAEGAGGKTSLGQEGDRRSQLFLKKALHRTRPRDYVLSEEAADHPGRLTADRVWIIDPLDGTREFSEGRRDWAVHVALWERGALATGAVALPRLDMVFSAESKPEKASPHAGLRMAVSRSRAPEVATRVAHELGATLCPMGSAGYKVCAVASGEVDIYLHAGGQYEWDSAAPVAVARAAGLHVSRLDGSAPRYNQSDPYLPDLVVCRPDLSAAVLEAVSANLLVSAVRDGGSSE